MTKKVVRSKLIRFRTKYHIKYHFVVWEENQPLPCTHPTGHVINMGEKCCILELGGGGLHHHSPDSEPGLRLLRGSPQGSAEVSSYPTFGLS